MSEAILDMCTTISQLSHNSPTASSSHTHRTPTIIPQLSHYSPTGLPQLSHMSSQLSLTHSVYIRVLAKFSKYNRAFRSHAQTGFSGGRFLLLFAWFWHFFEEISSPDACHHIPTTWGRFLERFLRYLQRFLERFSERFPRYL